MRNYAMNNNEDFYSMTCIWMNNNKDFNAGCY